ncbi:MAG: UvrB/UvrC motif-containing protein [Gemmataceae bacterium]
MPADTEAPPESSRLAYLHELPPHIQPQVQDLLARIDEISVRKVQAVAEQNFELAAQLRDEQERLKQERDALLRVTPQQLPRNLREYEVYVPLVEAQAEKVEAVRQKIVARFEGCLFTRQEVAGRFAVGPIIFDCKHVGVFRFLADEVEHAADFLRQLQEEAVTQLKLGPLAVVEKSASVVL